MDNRRCGLRVVLVVGVLGWASTAYALIMALTPLRAFLSDSQYIVVAKVEKLLPDKPGMILTVSEGLKGKAPFRKLALNAQGDSEAQKHKDKERLFARLAPDLPLVLFVNERGKRYTAFGFSNGTWFQILGQKTTDAIAWRFTHLEPYLRRTFKGTTDEQVRIIRDSLAGKIKPPEPNAKEPPGVGPEVQRGARSAERKAWSAERGGAANGALRAPRSALHSPRSTLHSPLFAVIPTLGIGGPLAILAILFPSVFGGVLVLFRRWLAFFSVISAISLVYLVRWTWGVYFRETWLATPQGTALTFLAATGLGTFWAWQRHWFWLGTGQESEVPGKSEHIVLWAISLSCLGLVVFYWFDPLGTQEWQLLLGLSAGVWGGTIYKVFRWFYQSRAAGPALPTEAVMLSATLFCLAGFAAVQSGQGQTEGSAETRTGAKARLVGKRWDFTVKENGCLVSSPRAAGGHIFFGSAHPTFKYGTLFCLERGTGTERWKFQDDGDLKPLFSSPCIAGGKVYIGEGFHDDRDCKVYGLDASKGTKTWEFQTKSQVESSPRVFGGKVFVGAGNDGIYCLGADDGKKLWQFPEPGHKGRLLRVGSSPALANGKLYAGSGVDRNATDDPGETAVFCISARDGKPLWKKEVDLPCWGGPVVSGSEVFFTLGNGDVYNDAPEPAGAVLCLDADTGKEIWRVNLPNGVLGQPAVDEERVYAGCRDAYCYCLARGDGRQLWKTDLGGPVISSPALAAALDTGATTSIFVAGSRGRVCCFEPTTGDVQWTYDLQQHNAFLAAAPEVVVSRTAGGERRQIYIAATLGALTDGRPVLYRLDDLLPEAASNPKE